MKSATLVHFNLFKTLPLVHMRGEEFQQSPMSMFFYSTIHVFSSSHNICQNWYGKVHQNVFVFK